MSESQADDTLRLRNTPVGRPQLEHRSSEHSVTVSEDYQSASSGRSRPISPISPTGVVDTLFRPSNTTASHAQQHPDLHPTGAPGLESFQPSTQSTFTRLQQGAQEGNTSPQSRHVRRKAVGSMSRQLLSGQSSSDSNDKVSENVAVPGPSYRDSRVVTPPTPETDDTQYIRFALDQLTRDEEVRGSRRYPAEGTWPTARRPSANAFLPPGQVSSPDEMSRVMAGGNAIPYMGANNAAQSRSTGPAQTGIPSTGPNPAAALPLTGQAITSLASDDPEEENEYHTPAEEIPHERFAQNQTLPLPRDQDGAYHVRANSESDEAVLVPYDLEAPKLKFLPGILRPFWLGLFTFLCCLVLAGLVFSGIWSANHDGLFRYTDFGGSRYFIFQYLPLIIGMFLLLWLLQIQIAVQRIAPFIAMASYSAKARLHAPLMAVQPTNFISPKLHYFKAGQPIIGMAMLIFWLQIFSIPLFATVYNVYYYGPNGGGNWNWTTVQYVVWILVGLYFLLIVSLIILGIWLWRQRTGLRWDPRSLADLIALFDRSNMFDDYQNSEIFTSTKEFSERLALRSDRLGYWTTSTRPTEPFYGIGEEGGPTRRYNLQSGRLLEKERSKRRVTPQGPDMEEEDEFNSFRYRYLPWYIRPTASLLWVIAGILLYLAFLVVSYINEAVIRGFVPLLPVAANGNGFSSTNFLYSFVPTIIAEIVFLCWLSIDYSFRRLQPYAGMSSSHKSWPTGGTAQKTLLLEYPARLPVSVTISALVTGDYRVAYFSFLSLVAATFPILAGGTFWAQFYIPTQQVRVAVWPPAFYALCVVLAIFACSLPLILVGLRKRRLPHACTTLAEQISWLYASNLLGEREWRAPLGSKVEMTTRLLTASTALEREHGGGRFYFGRFTGKDGKIHLGIERIGRDNQQRDSGGMLTTIPQRGTDQVPLTGTAPDIIDRSTSGRFIPPHPTAGSTGTGAFADRLAYPASQGRVRADGQRPDAVPPTIFATNPRVGGTNMPTRQLRSSTPSPEHDPEKSAAYSYGGSEPHPALRPSAEQQRRDQLAFPAPAAQQMQESDKPAATRAAYLRDHQQASPTSSKYESYYGIGIGGGNNGAYHSQRNSATGGRTDPFADPADPRLSGEAREGLGADRPSGGLTAHPVDGGDRYAYDEPGRFGEGYDMYDGDGEDRYGYDRRPLSMVPESEQAELVRDREGGDLWRRLSRGVGSGQWYGMGRGGKA